AWRLVRPLLYISSAAAVTGGILYVSYRPRTIPGSDPAAVPPPGYEGGIFLPPRFPRVKSRAEQIADLKRSGGIAQTMNAGLSNENTGSSEADGETYDLLVIGGGATGSGIALDAATRGLKVAVVERDDFSS